MKQIKSFLPALLLASIVASAMGRAQGPAAPVLAAAPVQTLCQNTDLFSIGENTPTSRTFPRGWQRRFPLLVMDLSGHGATHPPGQLYWASNSSGFLRPIRHQGFAPSVWTTDNVLVLVCGATRGDGSGISSPTAVLVNGPDSQSGGNGNNIAPGDVAPGPDKEPIDRLYILDAAKGNDVMRVDFVADVPGGAAGRTTDTIATVLIERHKNIHFSAGGGVLFTEGSGSAISMLATPTKTLQTQIVNSSTVLTGTTTVVASNNQTTYTPGTGTATFAYAVRNSRPQINGIAGLAVYPWGHDLFPFNTKKGYTSNYSSRHPFQSTGIFIGTSVSSLGNFTVGPTYEFLPGIQAFAGSTWYTKQYLPSNVVACNGYGTSATYAGAPKTISTQTTVAPPTSSLGSTTTTVMTTTTVDATNGCANGDVATQLSGGNLPTQSKYVAGFSFGIIFNTNLLAAFKGLK